MILCTRNGARFIGEQIESILAQTRPVSEIVLSDDESTDDTVDVALAAVDAAPPATRPRIVVLRNSSPLGVTANFEQAALASTGELIAFSDQDDVWRADKIARLLPAFTDSDVLLAFSDARLVDAHGAPMGSTMFASLRVSTHERRLLASGRGLEALIRRNLVTGATMMIRRELLDSATPFPREWVHDEWLGIVAAAVEGRIVAIGESLIDYRQHGGNQIGAVSPGLAPTVARALRPLSEHLSGSVPRAQALVERLGSIPSLSGALHDAARGKLDFELRRAGYPRSRIRRAVPVLRELARGGYRRFGRGVADAVRDILRPF